MELLKTTEWNNLPTILKEKVDKANFLLKCTESQFATYSTELNVAESVGQGMAVLLSKEIGLTKDVPCAIIEKLLAILAMSLNVGKNIQPYQLDGISKKIYAKYYYLSFDEIIHVFNKGSAGEYGKLYDRIDEEIILTWLHLYDTTERLSICEKLKSEESQQQKLEKQLEQNIIADILKPLTEKLTVELEKEKEAEVNYKLFREKYFSQKEHK